MKRTWVYANQSGEKRRPSSLFASIDIDTFRRRMQLIVLKVRTVNSRFRMITFAQLPGGTRLFQRDNGDPFCRKEKENIKFLPRSSRDRHCYGWKGRERGKLKSHLRKVYVTYLPWVCVCMCACACVCIMIIFQRKADLSN